MNFDQLEARYRELLAQRQTGNLDPQKFQELVGELRIQDAQQRWWQIEPESGQWLRWDGSQWQRDEPSRDRPSGVQLPPPPGIAPAATSAASGGAVQAATGIVQGLWRRFLDRMISPSEFLRQGRLPLAQRSQGWWDVLGVAGGALSGYIWFLYSSIRGMPHFKLIGLSGGRDVWYDFIPSIALAALPFLLVAYRVKLLARLDPIWYRVRASMSYGVMLGAGIIVGAMVLNYLSPTLFGWAFAFREGLDFTTPLLMVGVPVGLAIFRPETDRLLMPLQSVRQGIPKFLLVGVALAIPYALAFVLYRFVNQYELLHWNVALGILIPYALLRNPQLGMPSSSGTATLSVLFWLLPLLFLLSGTFIPEAFADDCTRDLFNLRDCLRTGGYAETISGSAASVVSVLVNGPELVRIFVQPPSVPQGGTPLRQEPPPQSPSDVESAAPGGRKNGLVGSEGATPNKPATIYGTGTKEDPFRDSSAFKINPDGTIGGYKESADAPTIFGTGAPNDPYSNIQKDPEEPKPSNESDDKGTPKTSSDSDRKNGENIPEGTDKKDEPAKSGESTKSDEPTKTAEPANPDKGTPFDGDGVKPPTVDSGKTDISPPEIGKDDKKPDSGGKESKKDVDDKIDVTEIPGKIGEGLGEIGDRIEKVGENLDGLKNDIKNGHIPLSEEGKKKFDEIKDKLDNKIKNITEKAKEWKETVDGIQDTINTVKNVRDQTVDAVNNIKKFNNGTKDNSMDHRSREGLGLILSGAETTGRVADNVIRKTLGDTVADSIGAKDLGKDASKALKVAVDGVTKGQQRIESDPETHEILDPEGRKKKEQEERDHAWERDRINKEADLEAKRRKDLEEMRPPPGSAKPTIWSLWGIKSWFK